MFSGVTPANRNQIFNKQKKEKYEKEEDEICTCTVLAHVKIHVYTCVGQIYITITEMEKRQNEI